MSFAFCYFPSRTFSGRTPAPEGYSYANHGTLLSLIFLQVEIETILQKDLCDQLSGNPAAVCDAIMALGIPYIINVFNQKLTGTVDIFNVTSASGSVTISFPCFMFSILFFCIFP